ncbi:hypothetical protein [Mycolicibacterium peregrinum]|nr:hypothetical protein [Mycolicibacterium peregrinum]
MASEVVGSAEVSDGFEVGGVSVPEAVAVAVPVPVPVCGGVPVPEG